MGDQSSNPQLKQQHSRRITARIEPPSMSPAWVSAGGRESACAACLGSGWMQCTSCGGKGCSSCQGGRKSCDRCGGTGRIYA
jgi:hypothetical protein